MKLLVVVWMVLEGSTAGEAGWAFLARSLGFVAAAPFAGLHLDRAPIAWKKKILIVAIFMAVILNLGLIWPHELSFMIPKNFVEGAATTFFTPARNAMVLGIEKMAGFEANTTRNQVAEAGGACVVFALAAVLAYYVYPELQHVFIAVQLTLGSLAIGSVCCIPSYTVTDTDARNAEMVRKARV